MADPTEAILAYLRQVWAGSRSGFLTGGRAADGSALLLLARGRSPKRGGAVAQCHVGTLFSLLVEGEDSRSLDIYQE